MEPSKQTSAPSTGTPTTETRSEHAMRRFAQIQEIERCIELKKQEVRDSQAHTKELKEEYDGLLQELHAAARDEGDLPLLDMMESVSSDKVN